MARPLTEQELAELKDYYLMPGRIELWLDQPDRMQSAQEYEFHEHLCNLHPEDALLCIALCLEVLLQSVPSLKNSSRAETRTINRKVADVLCEYGPDAISRLHHNLTADEDCDIQGIATDLTVLSRALEKLEQEIFTLNQPHLDIIFSVLTIQSGAQAEIARYVLTALWKEENGSSTELRSNDVPYYSLPPANDNLVGVR